jgi:hypothetical protein
MQQQVAVLPKASMAAKPEDTPFPKSNTAPIWVAQEISGGRFRLPSSRLRDTVQTVRMNRDE